MNNPKTCPECGMPLVQCDNCEEYGARIAMRSGSSRAMNRCYVPNVPPTSGRSTTRRRKTEQRCADRVLASRMRMPKESENVNTLKITKTGQTASTLTTVQITAKIGRKRQNGIPRRKTLPRRRRGARKSPESYPAVNGLRGWPCRASWHRMIAGSDTYPKRRRSGR